MSELKHYGVKGMKWGIRKDRDKKKYRKTYKTVVKKMRKIDDEYINRMNEATRLYEQKHVKTNFDKIEKLRSKGEKLTNKLINEKIADYLSKDELDFAVRLVNRYVYGPDFEDDPYVKFYTNRSK